jgi:hypothetical protein
MKEITVTRNNSFLIAISFDEIRVGEIQRMDVQNTIFSHNVKLDRCSLVMNAETKLFASGRRASHPERRSIFLCLLIKSSSAKPVKRKPGFISLFTENEAAYPDAVEGDYSGLRKNGVKKFESEALSSEKFSVGA